MVCRGDLPLVLASELADVRIPEEYTRDSGTDTWAASERIAEIGVSPAAMTPSRTSAPRRSGMK